MPLQPDAVVTMLLEACPSAAAAWADHLNWWGNEDRGLYNDMGVFAGHIVKQHKALELQEIQKFFGLVERFIVEGDEDVRGLAVVGLLETIQTVASHTAEGDAAFQPYLLTRSREAWDALHALWEGRTSLAEVVRSTDRDA